MTAGTVMTEIKNMTVSIIKKKVYICAVEKLYYVLVLKKIVRNLSLEKFDLAGASQVQWNVLSPHMLATAHDGDVKIWDQRKGNSPVQYIAAHLTKVLQKIHLHQQRQYLISSNFLL